MEEADDVKWRDVISLFKVEDVVQPTEEGDDVRLMDVTSMLKPVDVV